MKKFIMATVIAACIALCAAVWPQSKVVKETPVSPPTPAVCAADATVVYAASNVHVDRATWCIASAKMVHGGRGGGAQPPCSWFTRRCPCAFS